MRTALTGVLAAAGLAATSASGCGGSAAATNLANFTGTPAWGGALSAGGTCNNGTNPNNISIPGQITFTSTAANEIEYTNQDGCFFKFSVSGDTATMTNGPVKCSTVLLGLAVAITWTKYTATTTDGHHLTADVTFNTQSGSVTCNFTGNGAGTR